MRGTALWAEFETRLPRLKRDPLIMGHAPDFRTRLWKRRHAADNALYWWQTGKSSNACNFNGFSMIFHVKALTRNQPHGIVRKWLRRNSETKASLC